MAIFPGKATPRKGQNSVEFTIWPNKPDVENVLMAKASEMKKLSQRKGSENIIQTLYFTNRIAEGLYSPLLNRIKTGFPVVELPLRNSLAGAVWYVYISIANGKACLLAITKGKKRDMALRRAVRWMSYCPRASDHGPPSIVDPHFSPL